MRRCRHTDPANCRSSGSERRDLVFHVQEHQYLLPEAIELLQGGGLQVLGMWTRFLGRALPRYRAMFPDDRQATDPARWHALEQAYPAAFDSMYFIWCRNPGAQAPGIP